MKKCFFLIYLAVLFSSTSWAQNNCGNILGWTSNSVYTQGNQAQYSGHLYQAKWWTQGDVPGASQWGPWQDLGVCSGGNNNSSPSVDCSTIFPWSASSTYNSGDEAVINNTLYKAQWWTQNESPAVNASGVWVLQGTCSNYQAPTNQCNGNAQWVSSNTYTQGNRVVYNNQLYQAQWWTQNEQPGANVWGAWKSLGACVTPYTAPTANCFGVANWNSSTVYSTAGLQVVYQNSLYTSKWWTQGNIPNNTANGPWQLVMACTPPLPPQDGLLNWNATTSYIPGDLVVYNGNIYRATTSSQNTDPTHTQNWQLQRSIGPADVVKYFPCADVLSNLNAVTVTTILVPITDETAIASLDLSSFNKNVTYYDALGRAIQHVDKQVSPNANDIVSFTAYDANGRSPKRYIPFVSSSCGGAFVNDDPTNTSNIFSTQQAFYNSNSDILIPQSPIAYSQNVYESSPLGRTLEMATPGNSWAVGGKTTKNIYSVNTTNEVRRWKLDETSFNISAYQSGSSTTPDYYEAGKLIKVNITDVNGSQNIIYTDTYGNQILNKQIASDATDILETYSVYDIKGRLVYLIPPAAVKQMATSGWNVAYTSTLAQNQFFYYNYDDRNRLIKTRTPGAGGLSVTLYDNTDKPILTQSPVQSATGEWFFNKYDALGRVVLHGTYTDNRALTTIINDIKSQSYTFEEAGNSLLGYSNRTFPSATTAMTINKVIYYDNYDINRDGINDYSYSGSNVRITGAGTVSFTKNFRDGNWLKTAIFYDEYGRVIQTQSNSHLYLKNKTTNLNTLNDTQANTYDFSGKILMTTKVHDPGLTAADVITVQKSYLYDHAQRLKVAFHQVNSQPKVMLSQILYNEIGEMIKTNLHLKSDGMTFMQGVDYRYNIKGWLTHINNGNLNSDLGVTNLDNNDLFGADYFYEQTDLNQNNTTRFDGNISLVNWKTSATSGNASVGKSYSYSYDHFANLANAVYNEKNTGGTWIGTNKFKESITGYDANGNITGLQRYDASGQQMDNLSYAYVGNKLNTVQETAIASGGFVQGSTASQQYLYDNNGRLINDLNKGLIITYNNLELIQSATTSSSVLTYEYDADGKLLARSTSTNRIDYVDEFLYQNGALHYFLTDVGRVEVSSGTFDYIYNIKDHLGNVRVTFDQDANGNARLLENNDFYAFGLRQSGGVSTDYKFYYTDKEWQDETSLYDFGARQYDPILGRWHSPDPLDQYTSPYLALGNNPINLIDPDGRGTKQDKVAAEEKAQENKTRTIFESAGLAIVAIAADILTEGALTEETATAIEIIVAQTIAGGVSGAISGVGGELIREQAYGEKFDPAKTIEQGILGSVVGSSTSFIGGTLEESLKPIMEGLVIRKVISFGIAGFAGGYTQGSISAIIEGGHNIKYDNAQGAYAGLTGFGIGVVSAFAEGISENVIEEHKSNVLNVNSTKRGLMDYQRPATSKTKFVFKYGEQFPGALGGTLETAVDLTIEKPKGSIFDDWLKKHPKNK